MKTARAYQTQQASFQQSAYQQGPHLTASYLHGLQVQSQFKKHARLLQRVLYGFVVTALLFGLFQAARTTLTGLYKVSVLSHSQAVVNEYYHNKLHENRQLSDKIHVYSSPQGIEELARNNLEMVGDNEMLVRFH